jgi:hypothetical protein
MVRAFCGTPQARLVIRPFADIFTRRQWTVYATFGPATSHLLGHRLPSMARA